MRSLPRLVVAAPASGHGKTTIATGLMSALARSGLVVSGHKVGPDYIDPGYHALATGRPGRNLDPHLVGEQRLVPLLLHGAAGADLAIVEGVMGLYDGQIGGNGFASTAHVAQVTKTPVVLVVDISHASRSIGAVVAGMADFDDSVNIVGVILNKAGSARHADEVRSSIKLPVLGVLHRDDGLVAPSRHLGLVPADERDEAAATLDRLTQRITERIDLEQVVALARQAPDLDAEPWNPALQVRAPAGAAERPVIAMAGGRAFTFRYAETEELLQAAGCDVVTFDPLHDNALPTGTAGIYLGGGFPEVHAAGLTANAPLRKALATAIEDGVPTVAECAGLLYLCRRVDHAAMIGALPADAVMTPKLTLSYRSAESPVPSLLTRPGETITGHEFHRTTVTPAAGDAPAWTVDGNPVGFASPSLHASYVHTHWAGHPQLAQRFADAAAAYVVSTEVNVDIVEDPSHEVTETFHDLPDSEAPADLLRHHGDVEAGGDLIDFAVNVFDDPRPAWLTEALHASIEETHHYPSAASAETAIARRHGREVSDVLATAGAAEAFTLLARLRPWRKPVVIHPQFTEPDVALLEAGHTPTHVICRADDDFAFDPGEVPEDADLVMLGNPTNPTGVLHRAAGIRALLRPGRLVVVDEAFMDGLQHERESFANAPTPGLVVIRSLTKLWAIPGIRAGYVLGSPDVIAELRTGQVPWSVGTTAAAAMIACSTDEARTEAARRAGQIGVRRKVLTDGLTELDIPHLAGPTPFVLAHVGEGVRERLRDAGFAVRRADTFPGLDRTWVRIAARTPELTRRLLATLGSCR